MKVPLLGHPVVAARIRALGHVGDGGTDVAVRPEGPVEIDCGTSSNLGVKRSRLRANDATRGVATALEIGRGDILDRTIALDRTGDTLRSRVHVRVLVRLVEVVGLVANGSVADKAVAGDGRGESESSSDVLHCESVGRCTIRRMRELVASEEANGYKLGKLKKK